MCCNWLSFNQLFKFIIYQIFYLLILSSYIYIYIFINIGIKKYIIK